ncbi:MAG TPA: MmcQ/YjbR family DNA-binding protein [Prolixibacteraceae bacterium]|nr:MmcQ/YjbR family DNA-binding protein [Prolixibacteraceae bacterium]
MDIESIRVYCLTKKGVEEGFPFGDTTLVIKVGGKIFVLMNLDGDPSMNLKCDPDRAIELREENPTIIPGYHMNKKHWNTVVLDGSLPKKLILEMIGHSYDLVLKSLPVKLRLEIEQD